MDEDEVVQTSIRLPASLVADLKKAAKRERRTQTSIIETALEEYLRGGARTGLPEELVKAVEQYLAKHQSRE